MKEINQKKDLIDLKQLINQNLKQLCKFHLNDEHNVVLPLNYLRDGKKYVKCYPERVTNKHIVCRYFTTQSKYKNKYSDIFSLKNYFLVSIYDIKKYELL